MSLSYVLAAFTILASISYFKKRARFKGFDSPVRSWPLAFHTRE